MRQILKLMLLCIAFLATQFIANSQDKQTSTAHYKTGELIVKFKEGNSSAKTNHLVTKMNAKVVKTMPGLELELWKINQGNTKLDVLALADEYKNHPDIEYIEPNYLYSIGEVETVNDPYFGKQWSLHNTGDTINGNKALNDADIDAPEGWAIQSASSSIIVGILDTGVDWRHPDLIDNIWQNLAEDADGDGVVLVKNEQGKWVFDPGDVNGVDDDGNGYIDDFIGWNFVDKNNKPFDYDAFEKGDYVQSHGTHVAGIIGASGNNEVGISGVTQKVKLAALKFLTDDKLPQGTAWHAAEAINYAHKMGMHISNNSWGGVHQSYAVEDAILKAAENNHIFVTSAGNGGWDKIGDNISYYYPASYNVDNIIAVANSDYTDQLHQSSNYNPYVIDIAAPGTAIYSCLPFDNSSAKPSYTYKTGTSMAAPMVAGSCALLWEKAKEVFTEVKVAHVKNLVLENVDKLPQLKSKIATGGRLNIHKALFNITDTTYTNQIKNCRKRDSLILSIVYDSLGLETLNPVYKPGTFTVDYYNTWGYNGKPMDEWHEVTLNSMGCVSELRISYKSIEPKLKQPIIPPAIGQLSELTLLELSDYFHFFEDIDRVQDINDYNAIEDDEYNAVIPLEIFNLKKLKHLNLRGNKLSGAIPAEIAKLENLEHLDLCCNGILGTIPTELFDLMKLKHINFAFNKLEGSLNNSVGQLENLKYLQLVRNNLSGNIPESVGNIRLNLLDLGYNNFSGSIPDFKFNSLFNLLLDNNNLSGPISPSLSRLTGLKYDGGLALSYNNLSGCYEPALVKMGTSKNYNDHISQFTYTPYYNANISDGNNFEATWEDFIKTKAGSCWASATTKIWPGDMNNDGKVSMDDIIYYRIAEGTMGPARNIENLTYEEITNWEDQLGLDWENLVSGINGKHQDANGDGMVDSIDYQVIVANMGKINPNHYSISNYSYQANGVELVLTLLEEESTYNEKVFELNLYDLIEGEDEGRPANFHTLSAEIQFNETVKNAKMNFINTCVDTTLSESIFDDGIKNFSFAISKSDFVTCGDVLAKIIVVMQDEVSDEGDKFLSFKINSINSQAGNIINETASSNTTNSLSINSNDNFTIEITTTPEKCAANGTANAEVAGGVPPYTYCWDSKSGNFWGTTITTAPLITGLIAGNYTLTVVDTAGALQTLSFEVSAAKLEYDENGNIIECNTQIEYECIENLELHDTIPQGTYNAANQIFTDGIIIDNEEVDIRAGEQIQLAPGFEMGDNTSLQIIIDDCSGGD